jgi:hypothetical protein
MPIKAIQTIEKHKRHKQDPDEEFGMVGHTEFAFAV